MINLETPKKFKPLTSQARQVATEVLRPISRKYDAEEHAYPKELDMLAALIEWRPARPAARIAHHLAVGVLLAVGLGFMLWWARMFFTGAWAS